MSNDSKIFFKSSKPKLLTSFESIVDKMVSQEEKKSKGCKQNIIIAQ
jgi:hypothetical protein